MPWQPGAEASRELNRLSAVLLEQARRREGRIDVQVGGLSMVPFFVEGDVLTVDCSHGAKIESGDVIVFERAGIICAHRLLAKKQRGGRSWFVEKGDNQMTRGTFSAEQILGRVVLVNGRPVPLSEGFGLRLARAIYVRTTYLLSVASDVFSSRRKSSDKPATPNQFAKCAGAVSRILLKTLVRLFEKNRARPLPAPTSV
jgi:hypothetical protein